MLDKISYTSQARAVYAAKNKTLFMTQDLADLQTRNLSAAESTLDFIAKNRQSFNEWVASVSKNGGKNA
jgi:hypothetical protein